MRVAGFDYSTWSIDVVVLDMETDDGIWTSLAIRDPEAAQPFVAIAAARMVRTVIPELDLVGVGIACLEKPFSQSRATIAALSLVEGAIVASLPRPVKRVWEMPAQEWKQLFCGHPQATKQEICLHARGHGFDPLPEVAAADAFDAFGIAWAARRLNELGLAQANAEAVA